MRNRLKYILTLLLLPSICLAAVYDVTSFSDSVAGDRLTSSNFDSVINTIRDFFRDDNGTSGDASDDKIGIGNNTPGAKVHITGITTDNTDYGLKIDDSADSKLFYVRNDGQVEFKNFAFPMADGTTSQILKTNGSGVLSWADDLIGGTTLWDADADTGIQVEESADEDKIRFDTAGGERMVLDEAGFFGIGQSTPTARTHIKGSTSDSSAYALKLDDSSDSGLFSVRNDGLVHIGKGGLNLDRTDGGGTDATIKNSTSGTVDFNLPIRTTSGQFGNSGFSLAQSSISLGYYTHSSVVSGSANDGYVLDTNGAHTGNLINVKNNATSAFVIRNDGQVEFKNYTFPTADGSADQILKTNGSGVLSWADDLIGGTTLWDADADTGIQVEESADEDKIRFDTAGVERMIIDDGGNVGIGTGSPQAKFDILGKLLVDDYGNITNYPGVGGTSRVFLGETSVYSEGLEFRYLSSSAKSEINASRRLDITTILNGNINLLPDGTGNVGIGQTAPTARTHIKGSTSDNTAYALKLDNSSDVNLLSVKNDGLVDLPNTTFATGNNGVISKNGIPFIHDFNYGDNGTVTTIGQNTFIGENAGNFTMGSGSVGNYESSRNVAIGNYSLEENTTGYNNISIGSLTLNKNTTGSRNVANGVYSLQNNTTGIRNVAVGYNTLSSNTSGFENTAVGNGSLGFNTTGLRNVAVGNFSGKYITGGSSANTVSTTSVYLGDNTKALADGDTNEIVIGYDTTGKGSNTVNLGNDSITETHLNGEINFDNYKFPTADGTADQVLKTTGTGTLIWQDDSSITDHGGLAGLTDDDHAQYALLDGRSGGQTLIGGTDAGDNLTLNSTSNATKGKIFFGANSVYDEVNDRLGINQTTPTAKAHIKGETDDSSAYALKLNDSNNSSLFAVRNDGIVTTDLNLGINGTGTLSVKSSNTVDYDSINFTSPVNAYFLSSGSDAKSYALMTLRNGNSGDLIFGNKGDGTTNRSSFVVKTDNDGAINESLRVNYDGKLGLGQLDPTAKAHIKAETADSSSYALKVDDSSDSNLLSVRNDGNVYFGTNSIYDSVNDRLGIGVTTPSLELDIAGNAKVSKTGIGVGFIAERTDGSVSLLQSSGESSNFGFDENYYFSIGSTDRATLLTGSLLGLTRHLSIYSNGDIGIGVGTPTARTHIKGSTSDDTAYALKLDDSSDAKNFYVRNDGQVELKNFTLPIADGTVDQILKTDGAGALTWTDQAGGGSSTFLALTDTPSSFTAGSILFTSDSAVTEDNSILFWDDVNNRLGIGTTTPLDSLHVIDGFNLEHTSTEADDHAFEIDLDAAGYGDVKAVDIFYDTGNISAGEDEGVILINIDKSDSTGGDVFGLEVLATEGSAGVYGMKVGVGIDPVGQLSGSFTNMDSALSNTANVLTAFVTSNPGGANNVEIFSNDNDTVTIGDAVKFEEIEFLLETVASGVGIKPTFEYSTGVGAWGSFTPVDGTNGLKNTGVIAWDDNDIPSWAPGTGSKYLVRMTRTQNSLSTAPKEDKVQIASAVVYKWSKDGDVFIRKLGRDADNLLDFSADNKITFRTSATDQSVFDSTGSLGIGQLTPTARTHVKGTGATSATYGLKVDDSADAKNFYVRDDGQVELKNFTLPIADGTVDQILKTDGAGALTWTDQAGGGSSTFLALTDTPSSFTAGSILFTSGSAVTEDNTNFFWDDTNKRLGIGTATPNADLQLNGSFSVKRTATAVNVNTANEVIIGVTDTSVARTITLDTDDVLAGRILIIKDESGAAGTNNITIDTEGSETIDGQSSVVITANYGVLRVYSDGTNWFSF